MRRSSILFALITSIFVMSCGTLSQLADTAIPTAQTIVVTATPEAQPIAEPTADELLRQLKPTLYAKGADYTLKTLPEKDTIKELDVKAVFVGDKKSHSTTQMIEKAQKLKKR